MAGLVFLDTHRTSGGLYYPNFFDLETFSQEFLLASFKTGSTEHSRESGNSSVSFFILFFKYLHIMCMHICLCMLVYTENNKLEKLYEKGHLCCEITGNFLSLC